MTKVLKGILDKKHDKATCQANCKQNGKIFGQTPYPCQYYSDDLNYDNLLAHEEFHYDSTDGASTAVVTNPTVLKFFVQFVQRDDLISDVEIGVRKQEDVLEHEQPLGEL